MMAKEKKAVQVMASNDERTPLVKVVAVRRYPHHTVSI
jgi:hypothetical protein